MVVRRSGGRPLAGELVVVLLCALCGAGTGRAAPWNQDEDLSALGSLDSLLAYEDLQQAVQQAEDTAWGQQGGQQGATRAKVATAPWQPAEPDPQLYLLTEYDRGGQGPVGQTRVKRNREAAVAGRIAGRGNGLRRHARNPPGSSGQRLSIVNPLDVLRQRLLLEIARRRKASVPQTNREMLEGIGKRSWSSTPLAPLALSIEQQLEHCLAQLGALDEHANKPQDKLTRLAILYRAIEFGKCDITSDLGDQTNQRPEQQQQQQQLTSAEARPQEQGGTNHLRDDQDDWSARQQVNGWSRNTRAATSSNLTS